jgi:hypothetical protein
VRKHSVENIPRLYLFLDKKNKMYNKSKRAASSLLFARDIRDTIEIRRSRFAHSIEYKYIYFEYLTLKYFRGRAFISPGIFTRK